MNIVHTQPSAETRKILAALQESVSQALERKKQLGHYAVVWQDNKPVAQGIDAPHSVSRP